MPIPKAVNKDLQEERNKVNFNIEEFTNWFFGGAENVKEKRKIEKYLLSDKEYNLELDTSYLSYKEKYEEAIRRNVILYRKLKKLHEEMGGTQEAFLKIMEHFNPIMQTVNSEGNPFMLHFGMFTFTIANMTSDEQLAYWLPRCINMEILGTYAQTELGHGTYIKRLETTATYDPKTKEFVLNSPTLTAYKWWPGNLGHSVNYAVVMAQLYSLGENHGIQPFIVQLRDEETHKPMPGIIIGDIGLKIGFATVNNGYLGFKNVRIPFKNMLMKNAKLSEDGKFTKPASAKLNYGTMVMVRVSMVKTAAMMMAKAAAIALRYSMVRRQSPINPGEPEPRIIDHVTQQYKIFPALSRVVIFNCMSNYLNNLRDEITKENKKGNLERMGELHALTCCLKAVCTNETTKYVEICRLSCGGHGYLHSAGFDEIYKNAAAAQVYEGDNTVMLLQTSRFLMKAINSVKRGGKLTQGIAYLKDFLDLNGKRLLFDDSIQGVLRAVQMAAAGRIASAWKHIEEKKRYLTPEQATSETGVELVRASELHCYATLLQIGIAEIENTIRNVSPSLQIVFKNILELYAVDTVLNLLGDILQFVDISNDDIEKLQNRLENLLKFFRTQALGIVDAFDISDVVMNSTLGSYDGNVYERLFEATKNSPLNQEDVNKSFHLYLKPFLKSNL